MKILVTGHHGYIGSVMVGVLGRAGHEVTGLDTYLYEGCNFGQERCAVPAIRKDIRDVEPADLRGFDAVIHLAALSNDPLGCLDETCTYDINHLGSVSPGARGEGRGRAALPVRVVLQPVRRRRRRDARRDARRSIRSPPTARRRCWWSRTSRSSPTTASARRSCATPPPTARRRGCAPTSSSTTWSGVAYTTGEVLIQSDGTPWRPLVHVQDISRAFLAVLEAPREAVHNQAFNVGSSRRELPDSRHRRHGAGGRAGLHASSTCEGGGPDPRCYRVNCDKLTRHIPAFRTEWTVRRGVEELYASYVRNGLTSGDVRAVTCGSRASRRCCSDGRVDADAAAARPASVTA